QGEQAAEGRSAGCASRSLTRIRLLRTDLVWLVGCRWLPSLDSRREVGQLARPLPALSGVPAEHYPSGNSVIEGTPFPFRAARDRVIHPARAVTARRSIALFRLSGNTLVIGGHPCRRMSRCRNPPSLICMRSSACPGTSVKRGSSVA